jgi:hypothetical protein
MPTFRCTDCDRRVYSAVVVGAGDCPHCGGDLVFDVHERPEPESEAPGGLRARLRRLLGR